MDYWISRYALTAGIEKVTGEVERGTLSVTAERGYTVRYHGHDWHRTYDSAVNRALEMIAAKRKSIAKQLAKLDKLEAKLEGEQ